MGYAPFNRERQKIKPMTKLWGVNKGQILKFSLSIFTINSIRDFEFYLGFFDDIPVGNHLIVPTV
jgi:hypothetical protein